MNALGWLCRLWPSRRGFILIRADSADRGAETVFRVADPTQVPAVLREAAVDIERKVSP